MRNPVNRLATAAPRAFDSVFTGTPNKNTSSSSSSSRDTKEARSTRSISFDLDLSSLQDAKGVLGQSSSVVTFEELADLMMDDMPDEEGKWNV